MRLKICAILSVLLFLPFVVYAQTLNLEESVKLGLKRNEGIKAAQEAIMAARSQILSARGAFGPSANIGYGYTRLDSAPSYSGVRTGDQNNWALNMNLSQPIFTGFNLLSTYQKSKLNKDLIETNFDLTELGLILEIQNNFLSLLGSRQDVKSAKDQLERLQSQLKMNSAFYKVGLRPKLDVLQAEVNAAQAEQTLLTTENNVATLIVRLNTLLNYGVDEKIEYVGELAAKPMSMDFDSCLAQAMKTRPDLIIAEKSVEISRKDTTIASSNYYPQVNAALDYNRYGDDPTVSGSDYQDASEWQAGVNMNWNVFEWGKTYYNVDSSKRTTNKLVNEYNKLKSDVGYDVKAAYLKIDEATKRILVAKNGVAAAKESYRMAEARYQAQVGTNIDVLDAQANLTSSEADLTAAYVDFNKAIAQVYYAMGVKNYGLRTY